MKRARGQATLEFTILIIIIIGVFLSAQNYVKRGIAGRVLAQTVVQVGDVQGQAPRGVQERQQMK